MGGDILTNLELLFQQNLDTLKFNFTNDSDVRFLYKDGACNIYVTCAFVNDTILLKIISIVEYIQTQLQYYKKPLIIDLGSTKFLEKLVIVLFECICMWASVDRDIIFKHNAIKSILTEGIDSSPLLLLKSNKKENRILYKDRFNFDLYRYHYRQVVDYIKYLENRNLLSIVMVNLKMFFSNLGIFPDVSDDIVEVIVEIAGNALEHSNSDCLIDVDVAPHYHSINPHNTREYYGVNIVVINFSNMLFSSKLRAKILETNGEDRNDFGVKDSMVIAALANHSKYFIPRYKNYNIDDFFTVASFQHGVTGRMNRYTGGTGLTKLIYNLEKSSDDHNCYMLSGTRKLHFKSQYLVYNNSDCIGFNKANDFINEIPDTKVFSTSDIKIPGTAYNLTFIMAKE